MDTIDEARIEQQSMIRQGDKDACVVRCTQGGEEWFIVFRNERERNDYFKFAKHWSIKVFFAD